MHVRVVETVVILSVRYSADIDYIGYIRAWWWIVRVWFTQVESTDNSVWWQCANFIIFLVMHTLCFGYSLAFIRESFFRALDISGIWSPQFEYDWEKLRYILSFVSVAVRLCVCVCTWPMVFFHSSRALLFGLFSLANKVKYWAFQVAYHSLAHCITSTFSLPNQFHSICSHFCWGQILQRSFSGVRDKSQQFDWK